VLADIPGVLVHGRFDFGAPLCNAWELKRAWPGAELVVVDDTGHGASPRITEELVNATSGLAAR
jgi:proline iminopeptidase